MCARIEPTEEYVVAPAPTAQPAIETSPAGHDSAKIAPNEVATPFPPLNASHGEKQCPITAQPATIAPRCVSCKSCITQSAGMTPLAASRIRTATAPPFPSVRSAFIAPMLPLPDLRMSVL